MYFIDHNSMINKKYVILKHFDNALVVTEGEQARFLRKYLYVQQVLSIFVSEQNLSVRKVCKIRYIIYLTYS